MGGRGQNKKFKPKGVVFFFFLFFLVCIYLFFFTLIWWRSESLISSTVRISRIPSSVSKGGNIAQTWPIRVVISHGLSHGSKVGMETKLGSAKTSDHQSTPHDALTRLGERHPLSAGADRRHLAPLGARPPEKRRQHGAECRTCEIRGPIVAFSLGSWPAGFTPWCSPW